MKGLRRRLASGALALIGLQLGLLFAVPVSACCGKNAATQVASTAASDDSHDCCPAGAHPKGECPLHRNKAAQCRMTCGRASGMDLLLGAIGVLPAPSAVVVPFAESTAPISALAIVPSGSSVPEAPPPRLF